MPFGILAGKDACVPSILAGNSLAFQIMEEK